jgi:hypothetical protein
MKKLSIKYNKNFDIAKPFDIKIVFEKPNQTPLMLDNYISDQIDFADFDISNKLTITFTPFLLNLRQDVYTFLLRCNDLNFNFSDQLATYFQLAIWSHGSPGTTDTQKYIKHEQQIVETFKNQDVFKMKVHIHFPSLALQLFNEFDSFLSELILCNTDLDFLKYVDYRKAIEVKSHTVFVLHEPLDQKLLTKGNP